MSVTATRKLAEIAALSGHDPKRAILSAIGQYNIDQFEPFHNLVLVGVYVRPEKTVGGIIIGGDKTRSADRFEGKVGLVLKVGPIAFNDDAVNKFGGKRVMPGDWVMYRTSDAMEFFFVDRDSRLDGTSVRMVQDIYIQARIENPEWIY